MPIFLIVLLFYAAFKQYNCIFMIQSLPLVTLRAEVLNFGVYFLYTSAEKAEVRKMTVESEAS